MSWLARSIANTLKFDEEDEHESNKDVEDEQNLLDSPGRGVKEDFSELTKTLTQNFWGVASYLAPQPPSDHSQTSISTINDSSGMRGDLAEIGGRFRSGISKLSSNIAVSEITKMASSFLQLEPEDEEYNDSVRGDIVGVTDEVVAFVRDIAMHPETWLDFPVEDEFDQDFDMSDAQQEHALAVERLAPRLAALRIELCPCYMTEDCFWMIYFVLLHSRLDKNDAQVLSTPQIVRARASLTVDLQNRIESKPEESSSKDSNHNSDHNEESLSVPSVEPEFETDKHTIQSTEIQIIDKSVINEEPVIKKNAEQNLQSKPSKDIKVDDEDDWLKEENSESAIAIDNDEEISFSDLEEDDENTDHIHVA
jgi:hypothetical protein